MLDDLTLWDNFKKGDRDAFETIYCREFKYLHQYGRRFSSDQYLVEDCLQDLFVELWNSRSRIGTTDSIRSYLLVSLRRKIIKLIKSRITTLLTDTAGEYQYNAELDIESMLIAKEIDYDKSELIKKAFASLSARQKEAFNLKYYNNCKNEEIAEIMNISNQSVRNLIHRGLELLRNTIHMP